MAKSTPIRVDIGDEEKLDKFIQDRGISKTWILSKLLNWFLELDDISKVLILNYVRGKEREVLMKIFEEK